MKENNIVTKIKDLKFEFIIFIVEAICMILELVASRLLSPYFGNSNIVWTSIIGMILLSTSIGNYLGGKIADKKNVKKSLIQILFISAIIIFIIPFTQQYILNFIVKTVSDIKIGAIISTVVLFFTPSLLFGLITPIILKIKMNNIERVGEISGRIYAISTLGAITGTFLGGFVLIPRIGSTNILFILCSTLILLIPLISLEKDIKDKNKYIKTILVLFVIPIIIMLTLKLKDKQSEMKVLSGKINAFVNYDTQYGKVTVANEKIDNELIRTLKMDGGAQSASYIEKEKRYDLVYNYLKQYDLMFKANININKTLLIGGAGYSYPKYFISKYQDKYMDVLEIDEDVTEIAKKYFYLDQLIEEYNLEEDKRLNLINQDGRVFINQTKEKYDAILNDAFAGDIPVRTLTTIEAVENIKERLNTNGLYLSNIISSLEGENSKFLKTEINIMKQVFKNVYVIPSEKVNDTKLVQNNMVIATDDVLDIENIYNINLNNELILTDDYCPVDTLLPKEKRNE